jgi:hypothetical protein
VAIGLTLGKNSKTWNYFKQSKSKKTKTKKVLISLDVGLARTEEILTFV